MFTADAGIMFSVINPTKAADFEAVMVRVKEALAKSTDPKRKQQALGWRVFKGVEAGPGGNVVYMSFFDPPVKDAEYSVTDILARGVSQRGAGSLGEVHRLLRQRPDDVEPEAGRQHVARRLVPK